LPRTGARHDPRIAGTEYRQWSLATVLRALKVCRNFVILASAIEASGFPSMLAVAQERTPPSGNAESVVITGAKERPSDQEVTKRVESALDAAPYLDASHITVTTRDGVVALDGIVGDVSDLIHALRIASRVAGAQRVEESLEIPDFDNGP
jgi:BON domain-containing protein